MPPQLVVATSAATTYPGGVIALRATDWLAGARGTLSTESDARAISGECVRDAQKVATSILSNEPTAVQAADDTLEIALNSVPIEDGMGYYVFASFLIEGDWDTTDGEQLRGSTADTFGNGVCILVYSFDSSFATYRTCVARPRRRPHFLIAEFQASGSGWDVTDTVYVRALSQDGSTVEYLIDQLFLMPRTGDGVTWEPDDFAIVQGFDSEPDDGDDGGDDNGKFTAHYNPHETYTSSAEPTVGDYQRDPNDEFISQITAPSYLLRNSQTLAEVSAHAYSIHGADYREAATLTLDDFSRTTGPDDWGNDDAGFQWFVASSGGNTTVSFFTNGSQGVINTDTSASTAVFAARGGGAIDGAEPNQPDYTFSGIIDYDDPTYDGSGTHVAQIRLYMNSDLVARSWFVNIDLIVKEWQLWYANSRNHGGSANNGTQSHIWSSDVDISSWLAPGTPIGFRLEKRRYRWRIKIWDASGSEPGTWDMDVFLVSDSGGGTLATIKTYPYDDLLTYAHAVRLQGPMYPAVGMIWNNTLDWTTYWDDIEVAYDPVGDGSDMVAWLDGPSDPAEQITIPYGAWQMVYWGQKDWTELDAGDPYVVMDAKVWNDAGAAELQRAQALLWWFRSTHGGIVSMNWRSSQRNSTSYRVLTSG